MAPLSETERQKILLQQEIAKLSGAISRHATPNPHPSSYHPYRGHVPIRSSSRGRGIRGRGRGGVSYGLDLRPAYRSSVPSSSSSVDPSPVMANTEKSSTVERGGKEEGEVSPPHTTFPVIVRPSNEGWVKKTSKGGNMSLMTVQKNNQMLSRPKSLPRSRRPRVPPQIQVLQSTATATTDGTTPAKRVVIDGVIFQFEQDGKKLVRIGEMASPSGPSTTPTRQSVDYGGEQYRRTKRGDLVSRSTAAARRAEQARKPCRYYTKTGRCDRALTCPYQHIPDRLAICPRFLRGHCPLTTATCPLSHVPSPHNTPSCVHFQATATCRNGEACLYPHVRVAADAPVCEAFAREGWCDKAPGTCPELHVWECGEWRAHGTCSRGARCGLRHVLRAENGRITQASTASPILPQDKVLVDGEFEDQSEFIGLPGEVFSDSESEDEDSEVEDEEDEDEEDVSGDEDAGDDEVSDNEGDSAVGADSPTGKHWRLDTDEDDEAHVMGQV